MNKITRYIVYVPKEDMENAEVLFDATIAHLVKKGVEPRSRKRFLMKTSKAIHVSNEAALEEILKWVTIRDVATFPLKPKQKQKTNGTNAEESAEGGSEHEE